MQKKTYKRYVEARAPRSPLFKNCLWAFFVGGGICTAAEGIKTLYGTLIPWLSGEDAGTLTSSTLVLAAVILTGAGIFDNLARRAGAGTLVPITGFANAVVSPALDSKSEGLVLGVGAKIFTVAGPVLLYGILAGAIWGVVYWAVGMLG